MISLRVFLLLLCLSVFSTAYDEVAEFRKVLDEEEILLVLFSEECCKCAMCVEYEVTLGGMSKNLEDMNVKVVKLLKPEIKAEYGIKSTPSIVFIRRGVPVLYDGKLDPNSIYWWLSEHREPYTRELNDETFEHLTQAATGATTGDWLVAFYNTTCTTKSALYATMDCVATHLKSHLNLAIVNVEESPDSLKRFQIKNCPEVILFRHGKMYRTSWASSSKLRMFSERLYKEMKAENVPLPETYFDKIVEYLAYHLLPTSFAFTAFVGILMVVCCGKAKEKSD